MPQTEQSFSTSVSQSVGLRYLLYLPPHYDSVTTWPLIIFLHGLGERGDDLNRVAKHGLPKRIADGTHFPFIVASPQCPDTTYWPEQVTALNALLDHLIETQKVDTTRIYLTGLSMGGYGTYFFASQFPQRFAAIAPICGGGGWWMPGRLAQIPMWVFHGEADETVPVIESTRMVEGIQKAGGDVKLTIYPGLGHNSWTQTYENPELYNWFLSHRLKA